MEVIKFTNEEMQEIANLQAEYQKKIYQLGQVKLDEKSLEDAKEELARKRNELFNEWADIQTNENQLIQKLAGKYGDGSLNLKDGTFTPNPNAVQTAQPNPSQSATPEVVQSELIEPVTGVVPPNTGNVGNIGNSGCNTNIIE